jgi:ribonuclease HI
MPEPKLVSLYTDGACTGNPGPGGYGVILDFEGRRKELSAGYRLTTNNRMEILAVIVGLEALRAPCKVVVYTDSRYVADSIILGWAKKWRSKGWMRTANEKASNADLWQRVLELCEKHEVTVQWVKGHAGHPENERCDRLSVAAASGRDLPEDTGYLEALSGASKPTANALAPASIWQDAHAAPDNRAARARTDATFLYVTFRDQRELRVPLNWFAALEMASAEQRAHFVLLQDGLVVRFPDLDLELSVERLLGCG